MMTASTVLMLLVLAMAFMMLVLLVFGLLRGWNWREIQAAVALCFWLGIIFLVAGIAFRIFGL